MTEAIFGLVGVIIGALISGVTNYFLEKRKEIDKVSEALGFVNPKNITLFKPKVAGFHGSKTLWESVKGHETFWKPLELFLLKIQST